VIAGFTGEYGVHKLVYFEQHDDPRNAIQREKNIKHWMRRWKVDLIEKSNPTWRDLYDDIASA
jgi:putative endonuclease